jgi:hypothetical protein
VFVPTGPGVGVGVGVDGGQPPMSSGTKAAQTINIDNRILQLFMVITVDSFM